jgi:Carboxypeptidase regulatory-like domain
MRTFIGSAFMALAWLVLIPASSYAQASIAGVVKDTSGAVLPGVTVEAASPALIEKVRSAVTDGSGQYRIEDLRPGPYTVTFTLTGFSTVKREGIELTGLSTALVNADLKVGAVTETITVSGAAPVVDVQSAQRQSVLSSDVLTSIPTAGTYNALLVLVPGVFGGQQDVDRGPCISCTFSTRGSLLTGRANSEGGLMTD